MHIKYIGKLNRECEICTNYATHIYLKDKSMLKRLFPEVEWKNMYICENCAKREHGKKGWKEIKKKL